MGQIGEEEGEEQGHHLGIRESPMSSLGGEVIAGSQGR